jgi:hypothetical protein
MSAHAACSSDKRATSRCLFLIAILDRAQKDVEPSGGFTLFGWRATQRQAALSDCGGHRDVLQNNTAYSGVALGFDERSDNSSINGVV